MFCFPNPHQGAQPSPLVLYPSQLASPREVQQDVLAHGCSFPLSGCLCGFEAWEYLFEHLSSCAALHLTGRTYPSTWVRVGWSHVLPQGPSDLTRASFSSSLQGKTVKKVPDQPLPGGRALSNPGAHPGHGSAQVCSEATTLDGFKQQFADSLLETWLPQRAELSARCCTALPCQPVPWGAGRDSSP